MAADLQPWTIRKAWVDEPPRGVGAVQERLPKAHVDRGARAWQQCAPLLEGPFPEATSRPLERRTAVKERTIPLVDLKAQYAEIRDEVDRALHDVLESAVFIKGREVALFEEEFAAFC